jgi:hypothetical protein
MGTVPIDDREEYITEGLKAHAESSVSDSNVLDPESPNNNQE